MVIYRYTAVGSSGDEVVGHGDFDSIADLERFARSSDLELISARPDLLRALWKSQSQRRATDGALVDFFSYMSSLMGMGLDMISALRVSAESLDDRRVTAAMPRIGERISKGYALSQAMEESKLFPQLALASIQAGETAGKLEAVFEELASHYSDIKTLKDNAKKAAMYPLISLLVLGVIMSMLLVFVIPELKDMLPPERPLPTVIVVFMSDFLTSSWWTLPLFPLGFFALKRSLPERATLRLWELMYRLPFIGPMAKEYALANLFMNLAMLTSGGVTILEALETAANASSSPLLKRKLTSAREYVLLGMSLAEAFSDTFFPTLVGKAVKQGEMTGLLDTYCDKIARFLKSRVNARVTFVSTFIEPILTAVGGGFILLISLAIFLPIYGQLDTMGK